MKKELEKEEKEEEEVEEEEEGGEENFSFQRIRIRQFTL